MLLAAFDSASRGGDHGPRFLFPLFFFLLLGLLVSKIIRRRRGIGHHHGYGSPMQTLQERFARGEVDRAEFEHRKAVLEGAEVVPPAPERPAPAQEADVDSPENSGPEPDES